MKTIPLDKAQFDTKVGDLDALARDWAERECTSFDEAVRRAGGAPESDGSIWDMPAIDSKRVVSLLAELEPALGCKLPSLLIKRGGYATADELIADLLPKIRELCSDSPSPGVVTPTPSAAKSVSSRPSSF